MVSIYKHLTDLATKIYALSRNLGWDPRMTLLALRGIPKTICDFFIFSRQNARNSTSWPLTFNHPVFAERFLPAASIRGHYFLQDLFVAQRIFKANPDRHVDFGSCMTGFVAHVASFRPIEVFDVRPLDLIAPNLIFHQCDLLNISPDLWGYTDSVSCLHVIEHVGLGRYGDPIDADGHRKGIMSLGKILRPGGKLYLSVPIGPQRIEFNAHRVFAVATVLNLTRHWFTLDHFSYIDDQSRLHCEVPLDPAKLATNFGTHFGCGIFEFTRNSMPILSQDPAERSI